MQVNAFSTSTAPFIRELVSTEPEDLESEVLEETKEDKCKANIFPVIANVWVKERAEAKEIV